MSPRGSKVASSNPCGMDMSSNCIGKDRNALNSACEANKCFDDILIDSDALKHMVNDIAHFNVVKR